MKSARPITGQQLNAYAQAAAGEDIRIKNAIRICRWVLLKSRAYRPIDLRDVDGMFRWRKIEFKRQLLRRHKAAEAYALYAAKMVRKQRLKLLQGGLCVSSTDVK